MQCMQVVNKAAAAKNYFYGQCMLPLASSHILNILCNTIRSSCLCLLLAVDPYSVSTWIHKTECNELRLSLLRNAICIDLNMELVRIEYWQLRIQFPSFGDLRYTSDLCTSLISFRRSFSWFGIPVFRFQTIIQSAASAKNTPPISDGPKATEWPCAFGHSQGCETAVRFRRAGICTEIWFPFATNREWFCLLRLLFPFYCVWINLLTYVVWYKTDVSRSLADLKVSQCRPLLTVRYYGIIWVKIQHVYHFNYVL